MMTSGKRTAAAVLMGLVVAAGMSAPSAAARATCEDAGSPVSCQTGGTAGNKAVPGIRGSGLPDPSKRVGSQGRRSCYTQATGRDHICQQ
jgi:hypothetical protein